MAAPRRPGLAVRRRIRGFSQESLAAELGVDRSTVARWERGLCDPQPYHRSKLCAVLQVTPDDLDELLAPEPFPEQHEGGSVGDATEVRLGRYPVVTTAGGSDELEDMDRRELLRALAVAGTLVAVPDLTADTNVDPEQIDQYELLNPHLWQVFALSESKRAIYPVVRQQLELLINSLSRPHSSAEHARLCLLTGDLLQLAGEIYFDADRYIEAAHCYKLAADASREGGGFDLWACALTRHAYLDMYERRTGDATAMLEGAARVSMRGDSQLATRYWVAAVQAEAYAALGDIASCQRALETAEQVQELRGSATPGGWLRFDGSRLNEQRGTCYAAVGRADLASEALTEALNASPSLRRCGSILTDMAVLGIQGRDIDQVVDYGERAADLAEQTRSSGYVGRKLKGLRAELGPMLSDRRAAHLSDRIAQL